MTAGHCDNKNAGLPYLQNLVLFAL